MYPLLLGSILGGVQSLFGGQGGGTAKPPGQPGGQPGGDDPLSALFGGAGFGLGAAGNIFQMIQGHQQMKDYEAALRGPTQAELSANQAGAQAGGIARSVPGMSPAGAGRAGIEALLQAHQRLAPQRAAEQMQRAQMLHQARGQFGESMGGGLGALGGMFSQLGGLFGLGGGK